LNHIERLILQYLDFSSSETRHMPDWVQARESEWQRALKFTDNAGLTLHLRRRLQDRNHYENVPLFVKQRLDQNLEDNRVRTGLLMQELLRIHQQLQSKGVDHLVLKGLLLFPDFVDRPEHRVQNDYDLLLKAKDVGPAYSYLQELGYSPAHSNAKQRADHLPPLIKKTGYEWRGNLFDPAIPPGIELHYQLWESGFERISILLFEDVWEQSWMRAFQGVQLQVLSQYHELLYVTLHCCRHILRSDLRLSHLYELAYFLHHRALTQEGLRGFLNWLQRCPGSSKLVATGVALAVNLFRPAVDRSLSSWLTGNLSPGVKLWITTYGYWDAISGYKKNKNVLFLHFSLLSRQADRWAVLKRKLFPEHLPLATSGIQFSSENRGLRFRLINFLAYICLVLRRTAFHLASDLDFCFQLPFWFSRRRRLSKLEF